MEHVFINHVDAEAELMAIRRLSDELGDQFHERTNSINQLLDVSHGHMANAVEENQNNQVQFDKAREEFIETLCSTGNQGIDDVVTADAGSAANMCHQVGI